MDLLAQIRQRIKATLAVRPDLSEKDFLQRIGQNTPSWHTEILKYGTKRWPDKITLLVKAAKALDVSVGYLVGEKPVAADPILAEIMERWPNLSEQGKLAIVASVRAFADRDLPPSTPSSDQSPPAAGSSNSGGKGARGTGSPRKKQP